MLETRKTLGESQDVTHESKSMEVVKFRCGLSGAIESFERPVVKPKDRDDEGIPA